MRCYKAVNDLAAIVKLMAEKVSSVDRVQILALLEKITIFLDSMDLVDENVVIYVEPSIVIRNLICHIRDIEMGHQGGSRGCSSRKRKTTPRVSRQVAEKRPPPKGYNDADNLDGEEAEQLPTNIVPTAAMRVPQQNQQQQYSTTTRTHSVVNRQEKKTDILMSTSHKGEGLLKSAKRSRMTRKLGIKRLTSDRRVCLYCQGIFTTHQSLKDHLTNEHPAEGACCCRFCRMELSNGELVKYHKCLFKNRCTVCGRMFEKPSKLQRHMKVHQIKCRQCKPFKMFPTAIECARHVYSVHQTPIRCDSCLENMDPTERKIDDFTRIYCQKCEGVPGGSPKRIQNPNKDIVIVIPKNPYQELLPEDGSIWSLVTSSPSATPAPPPLVTTKTTVLVGKPRSLLALAPKQPMLCCGSCSFTTNDVSELGSHMLQVHSSPPSLDYTCTQCFANFPSEDERADHVQQDHPGTAAKYRCPKCSDVFETPSDVVKHVKSHMREFPCKVCPRKFNSLVDLNSHIFQRHTVKLKHKCSICGRKFKTNRLLRGHIKVVHKRMVFMCPICPELEVRNSAILQDHMSKRHPEHKWTHLSHYLRKSDKPYVMEGNRTLEGYASDEEIVNDMPTDEHGYQTL